MRLLIVSFALFDSNSGIQAFHFGDHLTRLGWEVTLACDGDPGRLTAAVGEPGFECIGHDRLPEKLGDWRRRPDSSLLCAWTPREIVRRQAAPFIDELDVPYVVHLEDNEELLLSAALERPIEELRRLPREAQDELAEADFIHPSRYLDFIRGSVGVTVVTEELNEFNPAGRPHRVVRPGTDIERFRPDLEPAVSRKELGLAEEDFVLVYNGTTHYANQHDMLSLYLAVKLLQRDGFAVKLVRTGSTVRGGVDPAAARALAEGVVELGLIGDWREIPGYLALADAFVQPGAPDEFNRYRLPSKVAEFLAMGRPVILPRCNIGNELTEGENAMLLDTGNSLEIAARLRELIGAPPLAERLGRGARTFAEENLSWDSNAVVLSDFYRELLGAAARRPRPRSPGRRWLSPSPTCPPRSGPGTRSGPWSSATGAASPWHPSPTGPPAISPTAPIRCPA